MTTHTLMYTPNEINFRPVSTLEEIYQNVNTILGTLKFSVRLMRDFGMQAAFIDKPMNMLHPLYVVEVIEVVEKYEPRVLVEEVKISEEIDGVAYPIVSFVIRDGVVV